jgi:hypothetical protein
MRVCEAGWDLDVDWGLDPGKRQVDIVRLSPGCLSPLEGALWVPTPCKLFVPSKFQSSIPRNWGLKHNDLAAARGYYYPGLVMQVMCTKHK